MKNLTFPVMCASFIALIVSAQVLAQDLGERTVALSGDRKIGAQLKVQYRFDGRDNLTGGQFRIHYDKRLMSVADLSECLSGLPESHRGAFSVCNDVPEKGFIQFVVFDLGRNTPIGNETLGSVTFTVKSRGLVKKAAVTVEDIRLAGPDGGHLAIGDDAEGGVVLDILR